MAKYTINSYDAEKDVANVTVNFKYKTVNQPAVVIRAHKVPVDDKELMDAWVLGVVADRKKELREAAELKKIAPAIVSEQTVTEPA